MYATTGTMFDQSVENYRNQEAIVEVKSGRRMTYGQWQERVHQMCNALQAEGVRKGDRVSTFLYNTELLATVYFACGKIGAIINFSSHSGSSRTGTAPASLIPFHTDL